MNLYDSLADVLPIIISFCDMRQTVSLFSVNRKSMRLKDNLNAITMENVLVKIDPIELAKLISIEYHSKHSFDQKFRENIYINRYKTEPSTFRLWIKSCIFKVNITENKKFWNDELINKLDVLTSHSNVLPLKIRDKIRQLSIVTEIQEKRENELKLIILKL